MRKILLILGLLAIIVLVGMVNVQPLGNGIPTSPLSYKNATFEIDGKSITLVNGEAVTEIAPGSASKIVTKYFGNEAKGDLNADGKDDVAFIITQNMGGTGTFYYVVVALGEENNSLKGTNGVFLGDRIAPQSTEIKDGALIVNYAERKPTDPMTTQPSVAMSKYLKINNDTLKEALNPTPLPPVALSPKERCEANKGKWLEQFRECENISEGLCKSLGGKFNECASACRHIPGEQMCTMNCVQLCNL